MSASQLAALLGVAVNGRLPLLKSEGGERSHQDSRLVLVATVVLMTVLAGLVIGLPFSEPLGTLTGGRNVQTAK
jgi:hypothetical protein